MWGGQTTCVTCWTKNSDLKSFKYTVTHKRWIILFSDTSFPCLYTSLFYKQNIFCSHTTLLIKGAVVSQSGLRRRGFSAHHPRQMGMCAARRRGTRTLSQHYWGALEQGTISPNAHIELFNELASYPWVYPAFCATIFWKILLLMAMKI